VPDLSFAPVDQLVELCKQLDPPLGVSMDPAEVNPGRGGWLSVDEIRVANLRGQLELRCSLFLISPDIDPKRALGKLAPMLNRLLTVVAPDGPVITQGVVLPDSPTPMPALRVPIHLYTESE
jgi:hypothetical protein